MIRKTTAIDNNTGKNKEFYELGKKMFDRLKPIAPKPNTIETSLKKDIELLREVNTADIDALEDAKITLEVIKKIDADIYGEMIDQSLILINKALSMSYGEAMDRLVNKALGKSK